MRHPDTALILATGGSAMVKAAYSAGKPAYGVGPGNVPAFIERTADIKRAVQDILSSKTFDNGTICASEQAIVTESVIEDKVVGEVKAQGGYFLSDAEVAAISKTVVTSGGNINPSIVGRSAETIAKMAGISVPAGTRVLVARLSGVGPQYPLSKEKLSPVLAFYVEPDWQAACERCIQILEFGGIGHTLVIHSRNPVVIREFAMKKPVFRILVNTPSSQGAIGATTGLDPALTLGCGTWGGSITADNVGPLHLVNVKRVAYGLDFDGAEQLYEGMLEGAAGADVTCALPGMIARPGNTSRRASVEEPGSGAPSSARPRSSRRGLVPAIVGPAAAADKPVTGLFPITARGGSGKESASVGQPHQTRLVTDEDIRAVVDKFLSEMGRGRGG